jgi:cytochrome c-type biogenesis protein CcmH
MKGTAKDTFKATLLIPVIVAIVILVVGFGWRETEQLRYNNLSPEQKAEVICSDLRAPGDPSTVSQSSLGLAYQIRQQVMSDLQSGMTKNQILDAMVAQYGDSVLAVPRFRGFGVMTWFVPFVCALLVMWGVFAFVRSSALTKKQSGSFNVDRSTVDRSTEPGDERSKDTGHLHRVESQLKDYL